MSNSAPLGADPTGEPLHTRAYLDTDRPALSEPAPALTPYTVLQGLFGAAHRDRESSGDLTRFLLAFTTDRLRDAINACPGESFHDRVQAWKASLPALAVFTRGSMCLLPGNSDLTSTWHVECSGKDKHLQFLITLSRSFEDESPHPYTPWLLDQVTHVESG